jgi:hypothetical protein
VVAVSFFIDQLGHTMTGFVTHSVSQIVAEPTTRSPS